MSSRSLAVLCLCLGLSAALAGCGGSSLNGSIVDVPGDGTEKAATTDQTPPAETIIDPAATDEICNDGADNDGNGVADCSDLACASNTACAAGLTLTEGDCKDGVDNDGNGLTDCSDVDCASSLACNPAQIGDRFELKPRAQAEWKKAEVMKAVDLVKKIGPTPECVDCPDSLYDDGSKYVNPADKYKLDTDKDFGIRDRDFVIKKESVTGQRDFNFDKEFNY